MRKLTAEFFGTFLIVFFGCGSLMVFERFPGTLPAAVIPWSFGLAVLIGIYSLGHISGAHFNPAVTLALAAVGKFPKRDIPPYLLSQFLGGLGATITLWALLPKGIHFGATISPLSDFGAMGFECCLTYILMLVVMGAATDPRANVSLAGLVIGIAVGLLAAVGGPVTGASMNPARSFGPALFQGELGRFWIYTLGPVVGAVSAALTYEWMKKPVIEPEVPSEASA